MFIFILFIVIFIFFIFIFILMCYLHLHVFLHLLHIHHHLHLRVHIHIMFFFCFWCFFFLFIFIIIKIILIHFLLHLLFHLLFIHHHLYVHLHVYLHRLIFGGFPWDKSVASVNEPWVCCWCFLGCWSLPRRTAAVKELFTAKAPAGRGCKEGIDFGCCADKCCEVNGCWLTSLSGEGENRAAKIQTEKTLVIFTAFFELTTGFLHCAQMGIDSVRLHIF